MYYCTRQAGESLRMESPLSRDAHSRTSAPERPSRALSCSEVENTSSPAQITPLFDNPFVIEDLLVFDDETMHRIISCNGFGLSIEALARALHGAPDVLIDRIKHNLSPSQCSHFMQELHQPVPQNQVEAARRDMLDSLFWEL